MQCSLGFWSSAILLLSFLPGVLFGGLHTPSSCISSLGLCRNTFITGASVYKAKILNSFFNKSLSDSFDHDALRRICIIQNSFLSWDQPLFFDKIIISHDKYTVISMCGKTTIPVSRSPKCSCGRVAYYSNFVATMQIILLSGDIETNPGHLEITLNRSSGNSMQSDNFKVDKICQKYSSWMICLNCRSLVPIMDELRLIFQHNRPSLISLTETWLNSSVGDHELT